MIAAFEKTRIFRHRSISGIVLTVHPQPLNDLDGVVLVSYSGARADSEKDADNAEDAPVRLARSVALYVPLLVDGGLEAGR